MRRSTQLTAALLVAVVGCSRQHFRERTDKDVEAIISQKNLFPDWQVENWHVYPDPRSRYADPPCSHPDYPPYPPDDFAARLTAPNPQRPGRGGTGRYEGDGYLAMIETWDALNRAEDAAQAAAQGNTSADTPSPNPAPASDKDTPLQIPEIADPYAAVTGAAGAAARFARVFGSDAQPFRIRLEQAVELAILNSREFQDRREDLYLASLPVTLQRYGFAAQAFAAENIIRKSVGRDYPTNRGSEAWNINTDVGFNRTFAAGGSLMVRLANQVVVDLSGPNPTTSISNLGLTFIQPVLRGGGFAVTLEALTQAERSLLYAIRSYARFRKVFYVALAGAGDYTNNPYGLQGLSTNLGRGIGANLTARAVGYLPTVLRSATLANERKNVVALETFLRLFENLKEGGGVSELQVVRVEQNLIRSRNSVLNNTRLYLDNVDNFKLQLGVPTTLPLELDETPLRPIRQQLQRYDAVYEQLVALETAGAQYDPNESGAAVRARWDKLLTESSLVRETRFAKEYPRTSAALRGLADAALANDLASLRERRRALLDARAARQAKNVAETPEQTATLAAVEAAIDRAVFEQAMRAYEARPWLTAPPTRRPAEQAYAYRTAAETGMLVAIQPRNERLAALRADWPPLPGIVADGVDLVTVPLDEAYAKVAQTALTSRLDLMNARAQVVDSWRQVTVQANALQGVFNVRYDMDSTTPNDGSNGLGFATTRTRHTVTLQLEPPFVRRAERNNYRAALISYQRSRRNLMAFEDNILVDSRTDLRQLRQLAESYRLQQRVVELAYANVDNARSTFLAPPDPASARGAAGEAAALTQQLLEAQNSLLQSQNDLFTTWVNYQTVRMNLYLDLELLPLDARGLWTDEPPATPASIAPGGSGAPDPGRSGIPDPRGGTGLPGPGGTDLPDPNRAAERLPAPQPIPAPGRTAERAPTPQPVP